jgi:hypothetical protein
VKPLRALGRLCGIGPERSAPPPRYQALADGLLVTDRVAEAWFVLDSANTDLAPEADRDAEQDRAAQAFARILAGYDCHLKVVWAQISADAYADEAEDMFTAGDGAAWAQLRVERLRELDLPGRHLLLGVKIADRAATAAAQARGAAVSALGLGAPGVDRRELARLDAAVQRLARQLEGTPWRATVAPVDLLAWLIARELHRDSPAPAGGAVTGARLAQLTRGKVLPYPDHLRIVDQAGDTAAWSCVLAMTGFPEELASPGPGEWLRVLAEITYVPDFDDADAYTDGGVWPVSPEASIRFRTLERRDGLKRVDAARKLAKEQRLSAAKGHAGETTREIEETEEAMGELRRAMLRDDVTLVDDHPRLVVTSTLSLEDLRARVDAVIGFYGGCGIDVVVAAEEQRELWLEAQPGDRLRVTDLGHTRDVQALAGSWFWGGAQVGDRTGPIVGVLTGSTPGLVRHDLTAGTARGDATSTLIVGRSGRGKTTLLALESLDAAFQGALVYALDFKGDLGGLVDAGADFGLPAHPVVPGIEHAGVLDLFGLMPIEQAVTEVAAQLHMLLPGHLRARGAETAIQSAVTDVAAAPAPATWKVIETLEAGGGLAGECGTALRNFTHSALGAPVLGRPADGATLLEPTPGLWLVQVPGMQLPQVGSAREDWEITHRLSVALMQSLIAYALATASSRDLRLLRKLVAIPEVHVLTATPQGRSYLEYIARVGRAWNTSLVLDTQDPASIVDLPGLIEQLTTVWGFQLTTADQQDALARLLDLPVDAHTRQLIRAIGIAPDGSVRHGHAIMRDHRFRSATVQIDIPSAELAQTLSTTPTAPAPDADRPAPHPRPGDGDKPGAVATVPAPSTVADAAQVHA